MSDPFIVGVKVILLIAAALLAVFELVEKRGRSKLGWAVLAIALVFVLR